MTTQNLLNQVKDLEVHAANLRRIGELEAERDVIAGAKQQMSDEYHTAAYRMHLTWESTQADLQRVQEALRKISDYAGGKNINVRYFATIKHLADAALNPKPASDGGVGLIAAERKRQVEWEGWTPEHDDEHTFGELAKRAAALAVAHTDAIVMDGDEQIRPWKMHRAPRSLVIAGALIAAEIDRLLRREGYPKPMPDEQANQVPLGSSSGFEAVHPEPKDDSK